MGRNLLAPAGAVWIAATIALLVTVGCADAENGRRLQGRDCNSG